MRGKITAAFFAVVFIAAAASAQPCGDGTCGAPQMGMGMGNASMPPGGANCGDCPMAEGGPFMDGMPANEDMPPDVDRVPNGNDGAPGFGRGAPSGKMGKMDKMMQQRMKKAEGETIAEVEKVDKYLANKLRDLRNKNRRIFMMAMGPLAHTCRFEKERADYKQRVIERAKLSIETAELVEKYHKADEKGKVALRADIESNSARIFGYRLEDAKSRIREAENRLKKLEERIKKEEADKNEHIKRIADGLIEGKPPRAKMGKRGKMVRK